MLCQKASRKPKKKGLGVMPWLKRIEIDVVSTRASANACVGTEHIITRAYLWLRVLGFFHLYDNMFQLASRHVIDFFVQTVCAEFN